MSRENLDKLMERWTEDEDFREELRKDPDATIAETGLELEEDELAALHSVDWSLSDEQLKDRVSKWNVC